MLKTILAILLGKTIFSFSRILKLGGGFAAPGYYALKIDPQLIERLSTQIPKQVIITGTNGKTTTAGMLSHLYKFGGEQTIRNQTGSNLERGIASTLISHSSLLGKIKQQVAIWEVDEAAFNILALKIRPDLIIFLNVFRDQLDRYGEVDSIVKKWLETIRKMPGKTRYLVNADDGSLEKLLASGSKIETYSVTGIRIKGEKEPSKKFNSRFVGLDINKSSIEGVSFVFQLDDCKMPVALSVPGQYNVYNAVAALSAKFMLGDLGEVEAASLSSFRASFGRFEKFATKSITGYIFLIKNPVGATQVLQTVLPHIAPKDSLLIALNDNFADGKDVSWIWDAEFERVKDQGSRVKIFVSGTRAYDMALRLKYAGVDESQMIIEQNLETAFNKAIKECQGKLFILPTYTALMELQKILVIKGIKKEYWRE